MNPRPAVALIAGAATLLIAVGCAPAPSGAPPAPSVPTQAAPVGQATVPEARAVRITYRAGQASGDTGTVPLTRGESVRIALTSDVADEAHLHGYDRTVQLTPGGTAVIDLVAGIPGEFELELHGSGAQLATLQVR